MNILALCIFIFNVAIVIFGNKQWIDNFGFTVWKNIYLGKNTILLMILIWLYSLIAKLATNKKIIINLHFLRMDSFQVKQLILILI